MRKLLCIVLGSLILLPALAQRTSAEEYIEKYKEAAIAEMKRSAVPASITLAQGLLETENGNSDLLQRSNNHFGIKCKSNWQGESVRHTDDAPNECFRKYNSAKESYADHSDFLRSNQRYSSLFNLEPNDYRGWAFGLKRAGYATNPRYPQILINNIEKYELFKYDEHGYIGNNSDSLRDLNIFSDNEKKTLSPIKEERETLSASGNKFNGLKAVFAKANTSLLAIASKAGIALSKLLDYNDLEKDGLVNEAQYIYLERKAKVGRMEKLTVSEATTLHEVSQNTGIQLQYLAQYNNLEKSATLSAGAEILLQPGSRP